MKKILIGIVALFATCGSFRMWAQDNFTLQYVIAQAQANSPSALQAKNLKENRYWAFRNFQSNYKPRLMLAGNLPDFNRSIEAIALPDGSQSFVSRRYLSSNLNLSLNQVVAPTGGTINVGSGLWRLSNTVNNKEIVSYSANPLFLSFSQPLFAFNSWKWDNKIEPIRYQESIKRYVEDMEDVAYRACEYYFNLLISQMTLDIAQTNLQNNDTIYRIGKGRYNLGRIAENELLQLELNVMTSQQQVIETQLAVESNALMLSAFMGNPTQQQISRLLIPDVLPVVEIDPQKAIEQAKNNRQSYLSLERRQLEAQRDVARAKGDGGLDINLFGSFGLNNSAGTVTNAYGTLQDQQRFTVGLQVPILDWGRQRSQIQTAVANQELVNSTLAQEKMNFEREIYLKVKQFGILGQQLQASQLAADIAQKRYDISQKRYLAAQITITDLNIALEAKDVAKRSYLQAMKNYWMAYYELRKLTLYDFLLNQPIGY